MRAWIIVISITISLLSIIPIPKPSIPTPKPDGLVDFWAEVVPRKIIGCKIALHPKVMDTVHLPSEVELMEELLEAYTHEGVCLWQSKDELELILGFNPKVFVAGHGRLDDEGEDTIAGVRYSWIRSQKQEGQEIGIYSCRTASGSKDIVHTNTPHLEDGVWVFGRKGATLLSDVLVSGKDFFRALQK